MNPEKIYYAMDEGENSKENRLFPYIIDKNAQIPQDWDKMTRYGNEHARHRTLYLDPVFKPVVTYPYPGPHIHNTIYEAMMTLRLKNAYGETAHQNAEAEALKRVGNNDTPRYFEEYIRLIHNDPKLRLVHMLAAVEFVSSTPYLLMGWMSDNVPEYYLHANETGDGH